MSQNVIINTANTISVHNEPGKDKRHFSLATESIFSFGDFKIQRNITSNLLSSDTRQFSYSNYGTLSSLSNEFFDATEVVNTTVNDLNPKTDEPNSYAYFGSIYTKVGSAINNIINKFPYAMLFYYPATSGASIINYSNTFSGTSIFDLPLTAITNQGDVIYASGTTSGSSDISLYHNYDQFEIQLGIGISSDTHSIIYYNHDAANNRLHFEIEGTLFSATTASATNPIYVRPTEKRYYQFKKTLSNLEYQLLYEEKFMVPNPDDDTFESQTFTWPKNIDSFNIDISGSGFVDYLTSLLNSCRAIDDIKTNWMVRTMIPENYLELDSDLEEKRTNPSSSGSGIYRIATTVYADEFDKIKQYIDGLAFAHSLNYHDQETIPNKFMHRLSSLLGWEAINEFNDTDIFQYLAQEDSEGFTKADYNFDLWKKILININWLYKKKGTRDALQFMFKLMGAPDCLVNFNEIVYRIKQATTATTINSSTSLKITDDGYPNYEQSQWQFQEGGIGRGDGDKYIAQWEPEFNPIREIDNIKVYTGDTSNLINSKQLNIQISPATAIECDLKKWYDLGFATGSTTTNTQAGIPSYINLSGLRAHVPTTISAMTIAEWMDYIYINSTSPTNRKTIDKYAGHNLFYQNLKDIYLAYYFWSRTNESSNALNFRKLEPFLELIQKNFTIYISRLIPATTILEGEGTLYRNTIFNRQKFVYPEGINAGSEFQIKAPQTPNADINSFYINAGINENKTEASTTSFSISSEINSQNISQTISTFSIENKIDTGLISQINGVSVGGELSLASSRILSLPQTLDGVIAIFSSNLVPDPDIPALATQYQTKTTRTRTYPEVSIQPDIA